MNHSVKMIYLNIIGYKRDPREIFNDWVRFKMTARAYDVKLKELYPPFVKWAIRYGVKR